MKKTIITLAAILSITFGFAQGVGINPTGAAPDASTMLDVASNDKGILIPRLALMATNVAAPVTAPTTSLLVYNTATAGVAPNDVVPGFYYWDVIQWERIASGNIVGTDDQDLTGASITGTILQIDIESGASTTVDLGPVLTNAGTDNQNLLSATLTGTILTIDIENGNFVTVDLASLVDDLDSDPTNEYNTGFIVNGTNLEVTDAGGTLTVPINTLGTDDQNITGSSFNATTGDLVIDIENGTGQTLNLNGLKDHDWYEVGTTTAPDNINDNIFTQGNVGIGADNPDTKLQVNGNVRVGLVNPVNTGAFPNYGDTILLSGGPAGAAFSSDNSDPLWIARYNVATDISEMRVSIGDNVSGLVEDKFNIGITDAGGIFTSAMVVQGGGNVGIGTVTPSELLELNNGGLQINQNFGIGFRGEIPVNGNGTGVDGAKIYYDHNAFGTFFDGLVIEKTDGNDLDPDGGIAFATKGIDNIRKLRMVVRGDGNIGIGISFPSFKLELPNISTPAGGRGRANAWFTYSDKRIKSNVTTIDYGIDAIMKLEPSSYFQHNSTSDSVSITILDEGENNIGFLAQDLYKIIPEAVFKPENEASNLWSVDYTRLIPVLTKGIQEQQVNINKQDVKIEELYLRLIEVNKEKNELEVKLETQTEDIEQLKELLKQQQLQINELLNY